jgi:hypothetical protein
MAKGADLPEPEWWKRARYYHSLGYTCYAIGKLLNRSHTNVMRAVDPAYRDKHNAYMRQRYAAKKPKGGEHSLDSKRHQARLEARKRWRTDGRTRKLEFYYRELQCL